MGFFDTLNGGLETFFKELRGSKRLQESRRYHQFKQLETTPFLFSSEYLLELSDGANKEEMDAILDYMYRFNNYTIKSDDGEDEYLNILGLSTYKSIENNIIDGRWKK